MSETELIDEYILNIDKLFKSKNNGDRVDGKNITDKERVNRISETIDNIKLHVQQLERGSIKTYYLNKVKEYEAKLYALRFENQNNALESKGTEIKHGESKLNSYDRRGQSRRNLELLENSLKLLNECEEDGKQITSNLKKQREQIKRITENTEKINDVAIASSGVISRMSSWFRF